MGVGKHGQREWLTFGSCCGLILRILGIDLRIFALSGDMSCHWVKIITFWFRLHDVE